jgi:DNA-directed RNA polymerase subunit RPC12/RpoP
MLGTGRVRAAVTSGTKSRPVPPGEKQTSTGEELHCKRCGGEMLLVTVLSDGDGLRPNLFRCLACDFYDLVKARPCTASAPIKPGPTR